MHLSPEQFRRASFLLFGDDDAHVEKMADLLQINERNIERMFAGERQIPSGVAAELLPVLSAKLKSARGDAAQMLLDLIKLISSGLADQSQHPA